ISLLLLSFFLYITPRHTCSTLFPYTTLFRSIPEDDAVDDENFTVNAHFVAEDGAECLRDVPVDHDVEGHALRKGVRQSVPDTQRSEEHTSELQSRGHLVCRLLLEKKRQTQ